MTSLINFCLPAVDDSCLSDVLCPAVFARGPVTEQSIPGPDLVFFLCGEVRGKHFLESVADVCVLSHWLESFQGTHTEGLPKGQVGSGQKKAVPAGQGEHHWCVFSHQTCTGDVLEGTGEQAVLDLSLEMCSSAKRAAAQVSCLLISSSRQLRPGEPSAGLPPHGPG